MTKIKIPRLAYNWISALGMALALISSLTLVLLLAAVLLGVVNAFVRPVAFILTLPITVVTLGLFLLVLNVFLLVFGMLLEGLPAIMILVPLALPIAQGYGIDPVHFGIMFLANLQVGFFTPPLGMNLFVASYRFGQPVLAVIRACWPFFLIQLAAVLVIAYWPWLSLVLVR